MRFESSRPLKGRELAAFALAVAFSLGMVTFVLALPPPGKADTSLGYTFLTFGQWDDVSPAWSPNGKTIAYASDQNGVWQIFIMKPDGSSSKAVTPTSYEATDPSWSPDSSSLAFWTQSGPRTDVRVLFLVNSTIETITPGSYSVLQSQLRWSPDGERLLFFASTNETVLMSYDVRTGVSSTVATALGGNVSASWASPTEVVYPSGGAQGKLLWADVVNGTGGVLLQGNASFLSPIVSTSASRVAYISNLVPQNPYGFLYPGAYVDGDFDLWVEGLDGSNATFQYGLVPLNGEAMPGLQPWQLYPSPFTPGIIDPVQNLAWSPNGETIAYVSLDSHGSPQVYLWDVVEWASTTVPLAQSITNSTDPSWGPDGVSLLFASAQGGFYHIVVMNSSGVAKPLPYAVR